MTQVKSAEADSFVAGDKTRAAAEDSSRADACQVACDQEDQRRTLAVEGVAVGDAQPGTECDSVQALPPPPANLEGSSRAAGKNYVVTVSNKAGYLCHVHVEATWPVPPEVPFQIFTHPDNSALFRDVKRVGSRKVVKTEPGYKEVQVEQLGEVQVLWIHRTYSTWLHVVEDVRDPECLRIRFDLLKSDVLGRFSGSWELRPVRDPATGAVVGCKGQLEQDVLPKGMPSFMARLPILGSTLRGISVRAVTRVLDDFNIALEKVRAGHAAGRSTEAVLRELCGPVSEAAHANGAVRSFAFDPADGEGEEEEEEDSTNEAEEETRKDRIGGVCKESGQAENRDKASPGSADGSAADGKASATSPQSTKAEAAPTQKAKLALDGDCTENTMSASTATVDAAEPVAPVTVLATATPERGSG